MVGISNAMLAVTLPDGVDPPFATGQMGATPKIDGIRAMIVKGALVSRTLKPIPNRAIRTYLQSVLPEGADGEVMAGTTFQQCTSMVMSVDKIPAPGTVTFYMFDYVKNSPDVPYSQRMIDMTALKIPKTGLVDVVRLTPTLIADRAHLDAYEADCLSADYEGVMLRRMDGRYKAGRSTLREGLLLKIKRFTDAEATVVGFEELVRDSVTHHHQHQESTGLLGALVVRADGFGDVTFKIGTGFSMADRADLWHVRNDLVRQGQQVKFKYMAVGIKVAPRFPVFLGIRHADDM